MPGLVIKKYRELRNFSQKYVASKMGISQNAYSKIENNITQLTVHHVKQLSAILEVSVMDLLNDEFEIHRPIIVPNSVTKTELLKCIDDLTKKLNGKSAMNHPNYIAAISLVMAADGTLSMVP